MEKKHIIFAQNSSKFYVILQIISNLLQQWLQRFSTFRKNFHIWELQIFSCKSLEQVNTIDSILSYFDFITLLL